MREKKLTESGIPNLMDIDLRQKQINVGADNVFKCVDVFFMGVSVILKNKQRVDKPVAVAVYDDDGSLILAGKVEHHGNEGSNAGNWSYVWTFDPEDIKDAEILNISDVLLLHTFSDVGMKNYKFRFASDSMAATILVDVARFISKWLTDNATEEDVVQLTEPGVFIAKAEVKDGQIYKSLTVDGEKIKKIIKDDDANSVG